MMPSKVVIPHVSRHILCHMLTHWLLNFKYLVMFQTAKKTFYHCINKWTLFFKQDPQELFSTISGRFWQLDGFIVNLIRLCLQGLMLSVLIVKLKVFL